LRKSLEGDCVLKKLIRSAIKDTALWNLYLTVKERSAIKQWQQDGMPVPPPHAIKEQIVIAYAKTFGTRILIETGTYLGDMLGVVRPHFDRLISIELSEELAAKARMRFKSYPKIQIVQGDSGEKLHEVLSPIQQKVVFWLDGHYSGGFTARADRDTPVVNELRTIASHAVKDHVILIDDARLFNGTDDYPTMDELTALIHSFWPDYEVSVRNDAIRAHPRTQRRLPEV
jgi:hypothetical protein